jgi:excisionase family DNA binding protein
MREELFLTASDVAGLCGVTVRTIYNWVNQEKIPRPIKIGRRYLWNRTKFMWFLDTLNKES